MEQHKNLPIIVLVGALLVGNIFFGLGYFSQRTELEKSRSAEVKAVVNAPVIDFAMLFIKKVLQAEGEIDFETRLMLENAVRDLDDEEIIAEWQTFTTSQTEAQAQNSVKRLLEVLVGKIQK